jgi:glucose-1-phosphate cytidylyltransferase
MKAIILAGGLGTRLREETEFRPKPMVEIGGKPILWHIMKNLSQHGLEDYVIATGYKSEIIKDYFLNYQAKSGDFTVEIGSSSAPKFHCTQKNENWKVTVADTGAESLTGERVKRAAKYLDKGEPFLVTYGDGLADVDIKKLIEFHKGHKGLATVTAVRPVSRFGVLDLDEASFVKEFKEKPKSSNWINVGYFVFDYEVLQYLDDGPLEGQPLAQLASDGNLAAYKHDGFWQPMDTIRETNLLNEIWTSGDAPWKTW